ncbi:MAG: mismatch repair endonuclease MutH [Myxococcaceae bacterium]|nr:mismatch repair endonuclease MutH [Myxococcaceae bacterium]
MAMHFSQPVAPPRCLQELTQRAAALRGRCLAELEHELAVEARPEAREQRVEARPGTREQRTDAPVDPTHAASGPVRPRGGATHRKGKTGQLLERALGATAGSLSMPDFRELGVELKTIPVDAEGKPRESTFVCSLSLSEVDVAEWQTSSVRAKLSHVLFVPIVHDARVREGRPTIGRPCFWRPTPEQEAILRGDFDDLIGLIALGQIEALTARLGSWLQVRPKAAHGGVRTRAYTADYEPLSVNPRGFYLRARITRALLRDPRFAQS